MLKARVDGLMRAIAAQGALSRRPHAINNVAAYSGGVDSTLAAALVHRVFPESSAACLGVSPSLSQHQYAQAVEVARAIGLPLWECETTEGEHEKYVENQGQSCYYCKTNLYETIRQVTEYAVKQFEGGDREDGDERLVIYNGTNKDDLKDQTRVGLIAAKEFQVVSPLADLTKTEVREMAKYLGLPNWNAAASPCLRSRLEFGIDATKEHLKRVEEAERFVRTALSLAHDVSMRVRFLAGNRAAVELDDEGISRVTGQEEAIMTELERLGFTSVGIRAFRSGSLSGYVPVEHSPAARVQSR
ncbi:hypothetical protein Poli38472_007737 [Pythium oligandrum]|uniref:NAD/GMP synthase domain-containing protein n=1 Tax=Pythium oligandrum TaxID=41045 RepID=A0A8K1CR86_PYTOL|nr:hypothetical protein Poli38472_007737 [Pythium oligandrum]|eukprot:TMW68065.1 hypothetical protein Poli38472_007737 [Pythium oligandrum]